MRKRAEEAALKAYPPIATVPKLQDVVTGELYDPNTHERLVYIQGYQQAEKDLELTWQDIKDIHCAVEFFLTHTAWDDVYYPTDEKLYTEALKRYNEQKNNSK